MICVLAIPLPSKHLLAARVSAALEREMERNKTGGPLLCAVQIFWQLFGWTNKEVKSQKLFTWLILSDENNTVHALQLCVQDLEVNVAFMHVPCELSALGIPGDSFACCFDCLGEKIVLNCSAGVHLRICFLLQVFITVFTNFARNFDVISCHWHRGPSPKYHDQLSCQLQQSSLRSTSAFSAYWNDTGRDAVKWFCLELSAV